MIVQDLGTHLLLITQPDHALAARRVMAQWPALATHPRRDDILLAIEEHDAMFAATDAAPSVDAGGAIVDFLHAPFSVKHEWRAVGAARVEARPWAGALIAHHRVFVYSRFRTDSAWHTFFTEAEAGREALCALAGRSRQMLEEDYVFVRLADLISLAFCTASTTPEAFGKWTVQRVDGNVRVTPGDWGAAVPIEVLARRLPARHFASDADLRAAYAAGEVIALHGRVSW